MKKLLVAVFASLAFGIPSQSTHAQAPPPYRPVIGWGQLPGGQKWGEVPNIAIDAKGTIFVFRRSEPPVIELDASGTIVKTWGDRQYVWPHGIRFDRNGFLWITDGRAADGNGQMVYKLSPDGSKVLMTLGTKGVSGDGPNVFNGPTDVAVAANGDVFVADGHVNNRIVKFTKDGKFIKEWGKKGAGPGEFNLPHSISFDSRGRLLVADRSNKRIQIFDQEGSFLEQWPQFGEASGIFIAPDDTLYVTDWQDKKSVFVGSAKDGSIKYTIQGYALAEGLTVDKTGNIYLAETLPGQIGDLVTGANVRKLMMER